MKTPQMTALFALLVFGIIISPVCAFSLEGINITPDYNTMSGDMIGAKFTLHPDPFDKYTSNPNNTIQVRTGLAEASFTRETVLNGRASVQTIQGETLTLEGWDLAYLNSEVPYEYLNITLTGKAPALSETSQVIVFEVIEYSGGAKIADQPFTKLVISKNDLQSGIFLAQKDLEKFRKNIDSKKAFGVEVSTSETIYANAVNNLNLVKNYPPSSYPLALDRLKEVNTGITRGEDFLDRSWAQFEINNVSHELKQLDSTIAQFQNNTGFLVNINRPLSEITQNRSRAQTYLKNADNAMKVLGYPQVRDQAMKGAQLANDTAIQAKALLKYVNDPLSVFWDNWMLAAGIFLVLVVALLFKPKRKRKKKGGIKLPDSANIETVIKKEVEKHE